MNILVKLPSRQRPSQCANALNRAIENQATTNVHYLLTIDSNDRSMDDLTVDSGNSKGKIHACNRGVDSFKGDWDVILLLSDDMICQSKGWDKTLIDEMGEHYPDLDGVLFHNDGFLGKKLNTLCILGRKYYNRFGYIYHPDYLSFYCDNEFMDVANNLEKQTYFDKVLFKHEHPANTGHVADSLYLDNNKNFERDKSVYLKRKSEGFKN
jgi:hypothetical protein